MLIDCVGNIKEERTIIIVCRASKIYNKKEKSAVQTIGDMLFTSFRFECISSPNSKTSTKVWADAVDH